MSTGKGKLECKAYYARNKEKIVLTYKDLVKDIEFLAKEYSSLMESYAIFCYPYEIESSDGLKNQRRSSINIYLDDAELLDQIIHNAVTYNTIYIDDYFDSEGEGIRVSLPKRVVGRN